MHNPKNTSVKNSFFIIKINLNINTINLFKK
jgi:hypothetical protein